MFEGKIFRPRFFALGLLSSAVVVGVMSAIVVMILRDPPHGVAETAGVGLALLGGLGVGGAALFFAVILPTMKYVVTESQVILSCGPFRWQIPICDIQKVVEKNVGWLPISEGWKLPGYALFKIDCADVGTVRMCATSLTRRILLIQTADDLWGITPTDPEGFVTALHRKEEP
jgi:hypothetical protein